jgi:hypothetical protein
VTPQLGLRAVQQELHRLGVGAGDQHVVERVERVAGLDQWQIVGHPAPFLDSASIAAASTCG